MRNVSPAKFTLFVMALGILSAVITAAAARPREAHAASNSYPSIRVAHMTLAALTATPCPPLSMNARSTLGIYNGDTATVYVGSDNTVTDATGFPIPTGAFQSYNLTYQVSPPAGQLWCYSVAGTSSGAVRLMEIR